MPSKLNVFEMIITPDLEYPMLCIGVKKGYDSAHLLLNMINLNSTTNWFNDDEFGDGTETVIPRHDSLNIINVTQLEKDTILVCYDSKHSFSHFNLKFSICFNRKYILLTANF